MKELNYDELYSLLKERILSPVLLAARPARSVIFDHRMHLESDYEDSLSSFSKAIMYMICS